MPTPLSDERFAELLGRLRSLTAEDASDVIDEVRRLTRLEELSETQWDAFFETGMRQALSIGDSLSAVELAHIALNRHEVFGRMQDFVDEMSWATAFLGADRDAGLYLTDGVGALC